MRMSGSPRTKFDGLYVRSLAVKGCKGLPKNALYTKIAVRRGENAGCKGCKGHIVNSHI